MIIVLMGMLVRLSEAKEKKHTHTHAAGSGECKQI